MGARRTAWKAVLAIGVVVIGAYFTLPGVAAHDIAYSAVGLASVGCMLAGVRLHRPGARWAWLAVAAGNLCFVLGDGVWDVYALVLHRSVPLPSVADALYLGGYPFVFAGVLALTRIPGRAGLRERRADAAIVSLGVMAISWHFLMGSYAGDPTLGTLGKAVTLAYPIMDVGLVYVIMQGLVSMPVRRTAHRLLAAGLVSMLVADFIYDVMNQYGSYSTGNPVDAGWLLSYVLLAAAALHPSMAAPTAAADPFEAAASASDKRRRLPAVALAGFVSPLIMLTADLSGRSPDIPVLAGMSIVLFGLVVLRMSWLFDRISGQSDQLRERTATLQESLGQREALEADLRHQAFHDSLTGLANRALLQDRVAHALARSRRSAGTVAVCFCDLDGFKTINDSLGHQTGDDLLVAAARRLASIVRPGDTVARLGGDEFAVLMEGAEDAEVSTALAGRIVSALAQPFEMDGRDITLSVSVGIARGQADTTAEKLLAEADSAMYQAKADGKSRYAVFEPSMQTKSLERLELTSAFRGALEESQLLLRYQPIFSLRSGRLEGFEALVRWAHPRLGLIEPGRFIPLAEETGFIVPIGRWVLEAASEQTARWNRDRPDHPLGISINLSSRQLEDVNLIDDLRTALAMSGLSPQRLTLEMTEGVLMSERAGPILDAIKQLGVRLAVDDFGTGYSALSYLHRFPVDVLKLDKSFVDPLVDAGSDESLLMHSVLRLARNLGLHTVAEGVETPVQRGVLAALGCDSAQGYLLGRPLDLAAATDLVLRSTAPAVAPARLSGAPAPSA